MAIHTPFPRMNRQTKSAYPARPPPARPYHLAWAPLSTSPSPASSAAATPRQTPSPGSGSFGMRLDAASPPPATATASTPPLSTSSTALPQLPLISPIDSPLTSIGGQRDVSSPDIRSFFVPRSSIGRATPLMGSPDSTHLPYLAEEPLEEIKHAASCPLSPVAYAPTQQSSPSLSPRQSPGTGEVSGDSRSSHSSRSRGSRPGSHPRQRGSLSASSSSSGGVYEHFALSGSTSPPPLPSLSASAPSPSNRLSIPSPSFQLSPYRAGHRTPSPPSRLPAPVPTVLHVIPEYSASSNPAVVSVSPNSPRGQGPFKSTADSGSSISPSLLAQSPAAGQRELVLRSVSPTVIPLPSSSSCSSESFTSANVSNPASGPTRRRQVPALRLEIPTSNVQQNPSQVPQVNVPPVRTPSVLGLSKPVAPEETVPLLGVNSGAARTFNALTACMESLTDTGLPLNRDPPEIVLLGGPGSGKTRLVGDLLGLALPDDPTQCPIMYTLTRTPGRWICQLTLIRHRDPLSASFENVTGEPFGAPLLDPAELAHALRSAAVQLVPPGTAFTRDVICVNISAPAVPELCIFDLPGMTGGDRETRALAKLCSQSARTLILLAVSCETEVETLSALRLARENDPSGERTIGVLTKADRLDSASHWVKLLRGEEHPLPHGWFSPRNSPALQHALGADAQLRVGRAAFSRKLEEVLTQMTRERTRELQRVASERLEVVSEELKTIPPSPTGDPSAEIFKLLLSFNQDITQLMSGSPSAASADGAFWSCVRAEQQALRRELLRGAPKFVPWLRSCDVRDLNWLEDPDCVDRVEFTMRHGEEVYLDEVATQMSSGIHFRGNCSCSVQQRNIKESTATWSQPSYRFLHAVEQHVERELRERVHKHFGRCQHGGLDGQVYSLALSQVRECRRRTAAQLDDLLESANVPVMLGSVAYDHYKRIFEEHYREALLCSRGYAETVSLLRTGAGAEVIEALRGLGIPDLSSSDLMRLFPSTPYDAALESMASTRAYYQVALQCFLNTAVQLTISAFLVPLSRGLGAALVDGLQVGNHGQAAQWMEQDPATRARRTELEQKRQRLQRGVDSLARLSLPR